MTKSGLNAIRWMRKGMDRQNLAVLETLQNTSIFQNAATIGALFADELNLVL